MLTGFVEIQNSRLNQLLLLAITVLVQSVMAIAVANSIFVSQLGADHLPLAFIGIGLCSMPAYVAVSQIVQRVRSTELFRWAALLLLLLLLGLRLALPLDRAVVYYGLLIVSFFQWDICNNILYPGLLMDYFTTLEYKQYTPYIGIAQAVGTLIGGSLVGLLSQYLDTQDLLLCLPVVLAIAIIQLTYLERTQRPLSTAPSSGETVGPLESLRSFPDLAQRYPLVIFLAASSFLLVIIYLSSEFLWFSIYGQQFDEQALTGFLGLMRVVVSITQMAVLYGFTRPMLRWLGVARMNVVFPLTTLGAFIGLGFNGHLPAAIGLQLNGDALYKAINLPVHQLNYSAIPREFLGRIRALSDGLIYAIGLTLAGLFLWLGEHSFTLNQITWFVAGLVVLFLAVRVPMGQFYTAGLENLIRTDAIDLDQLASRQSILPLQSNGVIQTLLRSQDRYDQIKGLELAARLADPREFITEVLELLPTADRQVRAAVVTLFCAESLDDETLDLWRAQLESSQPLSSRLTALEILLVQQQPLDQSRLEELGHREDASLRSLATVARLIDADGEQTQTTLATLEAIDDATAKVVARVLARSGNQALLELLMTKLLPQGSSDTQKLCLETLVALAEADLVSEQRRPELLALGQTYVGHEQPSVRLAALELLQASQLATPPDLVPLLGDSDPQVRNQAAHWLGRANALTIAAAQLQSDDEVRVDAAIAAIGKMRSRRASDLLYAHLSPEFRQLTYTRRWQNQLPGQDPAWQPLVVAIEDYHQRLIQKVLYVLSSLGHRTTVNTVNQIFAATNRCDRANAIEVLASLSHRRFVLPLLPLLEQDIDASNSSSRPALQSLKWLHSKGYKILLEAIESEDRWLRAGALIALAKIPQASLGDPDPVVQTTACDLFPKAAAALLSPTSDTLMNRLLTLKDVALFRNLSLDELLLIDEALVQQQLMAGETVFEEGSWGSHLYIVAAGTVQIVKTIDGEQREIRQVKTGSYFGEVALFDDAPRWNGAQVVEDCLLLKLEKQRFISLTTQRPHILLEICRFMSQQLRETDHYRSAKKLTTEASISPAQASTY